MLRAQGNKRLDWNSRGAWKEEGEAKHTKWAAAERLMASVWGMQQERRQLRWEEMRAMPGRNYLNPAILSGSWSICPLNPESPSHTSPNYRMPTADTRRTKSCQRKQENKELNKQGMAQLGELWQTIWIPSFKAGEKDMLVWSTSY